MNTLTTKRHIKWRQRDTKCLQGDKKWLQRQREKTIKIYVLITESKKLTPAFVFFLRFFRCKETQKTINRHKVITESRADKKQPGVLIPLSPADSRVGDILGQLGRWAFTNVGYLQRHRLPWYTDGCSFTSRLSSPEQMVRQTHYYGKYWMQEFFLLKDDFYALVLLLFIKVKDKSQVGNHRKKVASHNYRTCLRNITF